MNLKKSENDFQDIVSINITILNYFGIIPPDLDSLMVTIFYLARVLILMVFFFMGLVTSELGYMYLSFGDVDALAAGSFLLNANFLTIILYYYIFKYRNRLKRLVQTINRPEFQPKTQKQYDIFKGYVRTSRRITISLQVACISTCLFWGIYPFTVTGRPFLPTPGYIPYNTDKSPIFEITFLYEVLATICSGVMNTSALSLIAENFKKPYKLRGRPIISISPIWTQPCMIEGETSSLHSHLTRSRPGNSFSGLIMVVCAELKMLNDSFENLREYSKINTRNEKYNDIEGNLELEYYMKQNFVNCITQHKCILRFTNEISLIFGKAILGQYFIVVIILCTALFQMTKVPLNSIQFFSYVLFQYCAATGIFVLCYFGNEVIAESSKLNDSAFSCCWPDCSQNLKKNILIFMSYSQRNIELYAGNVFSISLENFVKIVKSAVSYFTVLQQFSSDVV